MVKKKLIPCWVDEEKARIFKVRCAEYNIAMVRILEPAVDEFLRKNPPKPEKRSVVE